MGMIGLRAISAATLALSVFLIGCGKDKPAADASAETAQAETRQRSFRAEDFVDKTFAILSGSSFEATARDVIGTTRHKYYNTPAESMEAVRNGEADATLVEEPVGRKFAAQFPDVTILYPAVDIENYAVIFPKSDNGKLRDEFNEFFAKIREDGTYADMVKRWVDMPESPPMPEIKLDAPKKGKLIYATSDCDEPFSYKDSDGKLIGFDIELALRFAQSTGYDLEIRVMDFPDIIPAIQADRLHFASNLITVTEERKTFIDFSTPVYFGGTVVLTKK